MSRKAFNWLDNDTLADGDQPSGREETLPDPGARQDMRLRSRFGNNRSRRGDSRLEHGLANIQLCERGCPDRNPSGWPSIQPIIDVELLGPYTSSVSGGCICVSSHLCCLLLDPCDSTALS